jgi:hypothetical protein
MLDGLHVNICASIVTARSVNSVLEPRQKPRLSLRCTPSHFQVAHCYVKHLVPWARVSKVDPRGANEALRGCRTSYWPIQKPRVSHLTSSQAEIIHLKCQGLL